MTEWKRRRRIPLLLPEKFRLTSKPFPDRIHFIKKPMDAPTGRTHKDRMTLLFGKKA
jgi:hypothetical protein